MCFPILESYRFRSFGSEPGTGRVLGRQARRRQLQWRERFVFKFQQRGPHERDLSRCRFERHLFSRRDHGERGHPRRKDAKRHLVGIHMESACRDGKLPGKATGRNQPGFYQSAGLEHGRIEHARGSTRRESSRERKLQSCRPDGSKLNPSECERRELSRRHCGRSELHGRCIR